jgi:hypothetical protein
LMPQYTHQVVSMANLVNFLRRGSTKLPDRNSTAAALVESAITMISSSWVHMNMKIYSLDIITSGLQIHSEHHQRIRYITP